MENSELNLLKQYTAETGNEAYVYGCMTDEYVKWLQDKLSQKISEEKNRGFVHFNDNNPNFYVGKRVQIRGYYSMKADFKPVEYENGAPVRFVEPISQDAKYVEWIGKIASILKNADGSFMVNFEAESLSTKRSSGEDWVGVTPYISNLWDDAVLCLLDN